MSDTRHNTLAVALIGPDGAGKTLITRRVAELLPVPARRIYMGVNLQSSGLMLPTTRLILMAKQARGGRPDLTVSARPAARARRPRARVASSVKSGARMANWIAEEWFRQAVASYWRRRGCVVLFDRHFFCDYHAFDIARRYGPRPLSARIHGLMLERLYPRPDVVVYLDADPAVLHARKQEGTIESIAERRRDYLSLADVFDRFEAVDAAREPDTVAADVRDIILRHLASTTDRRRVHHDHTEMRAAA